MYLQSFIVLIRIYMLIFPYKDNLSPFSQFEEQISSKTSYLASQKLGTHLRKANVQAFITTSARTKTSSDNLNIFSPLAFDKKHLIQNTFEDWVCFYTKESAEIYMKKDPINTRLIFKDEYFGVNGIFPHPPQ